ncbi:MAG: metallophosphoesterase [Pirellulaceae bacterium]|nr:MAG: metallophosphoesterase [Pirellulaceae bacterium]
MSGGEEPPAPPEEGCVRLVMMGDIVGKPGVRIACRAVNWLRTALHADLIVANAENAADGSGLRCDQYRKLTQAGIDGITLGDHVFRKREIVDILAAERNIVRPVNLPPTAPGATHMLLRTARGIPVAVLCALGRIFMPPNDCPFRRVPQELDRIPTEVKIRLLDFHAEATSDMQMMGRYLDGKISAVLGTHTHVATADQQILPGGTAFQCDVGMTGPFEGILGRKIAPVLDNVLTGLPVPFQVSTKDVRLNATWFDADATTGLCRAIGRIAIAETELPG